MEQDLFPSALVIGIDKGKTTEGEEVFVSYPQSASWTSSGERPIGRVATVTSGFEQSTLATTARPDATLLLTVLTDATPTWFATDRALVADSKAKCDSGHFGLVRAL